MVAISLEMAGIEDQYFLNQIWTVSRPGPLGQEFPRSGVSAGLFFEKTATAR